ncbi:MAG: hypothetical protein K2X90_01175 [Candidatus Babeliaceae bacterium]|nr:hypothetical protein [Candidatus Babeliaceae bacterium]
MKKFCCLMIFLMRILSAMDNYQERASLPVILRAAIEIKARENVIKKQIDQEAQEIPQSVPDFFGIFTECCLPEALACCSDQLVRQNFLDGVHDEHIRKALALNWLAYERKHNRVSIFGSKLFAQKYGLEKSLSVRAGKLMCHGIKSKNTL